MGVVVKLCHECVWGEVEAYLTRALDGEPHCTGATWERAPCGHCDGHQGRATGHSGGCGLWRRGEMADSER